MATAIFDAYNAYLALHKTALPAVDAKGAVYDGRAAAYTTSTDFVVVGAQDLANTGPDLAIDAGRQAWVAIRAQLPPRDETFTIYAVHVAWIGNTDLSDCRARAKTNIAAVEAAVLADLSLGGALPGPCWAQLSIVSLSPMESSQGASLHVLTALDCRARI